MMEQIIHADIFFFVSTIALVCVTAGVIVIIVYVIGIVRDVRTITRRIGKESEAIVRDIHALRTKLNLKWSSLYQIARFFMSAPKKNRARSGRKRAADTEE